MLDVNDMIALTLRSGPRKGTMWTLSSQPLCIGRDSECDIVVPEDAVSRRHCLVSAVGDGALILDLGSRNATLLNGQPIREAKLKLGDEVSIGRSSFLVTGGPGHISLGHTNTNGKTARIALSAQGDAHPETMIKGLPQNVGDLARLFRCCRNIVLTDSLGECLAALDADLQDRFAPATHWIGLSDADNKVRVASCGGKAAALPERFPLKLVERAIAEESPICINGPWAKDVDPNAQRPLMIAPIKLRRKIIGAFAVEACDSVASFSVTDIEYLTALAYAAAPFFKVHEVRRELEAEVVRCQSNANLPVNPLVGKSDRFQAAVLLVEAVATSDQPVLLLGATGTGKELFARLVHDKSGRSHAPYVTTNCAAIPNELFESEVFGHERGAFTGAVSQRCGLIEQSHRGTLFLDEVADLSLQNQARLLRAIETGCFRRVGGSSDIAVDVRIVAATNKDLRDCIRRGQFREDLYQRIRGLEVRIPSLAERRDDIALLAEHFLLEYNAKATVPVVEITSEGMNYLRKQDWLGNVRELRHCVQAAAVLARGRPLDIAAFEMVRQGNTSQECVPCTLAEMEKRYILEVLEYASWNVPKAAKLLGIGRSTLYQMISDHSLQRTTK